jgi:hypothetical protein
MPRPLQRKSGVTIERAEGIEDSSRTLLWEHHLFSDSQFGRFRGFANAMTNN